VPLGQLALGCHGIEKVTRFRSSAIVRQSAGSCGLFQLNHKPFRGHGGFHDAP
jgi:hypothetical protein